jgi:hypothetical protein
VQEQIHLLQGLLHVLNMHAGRLGEHLSLPQVAAQHTEVIGWPKGSGQQTKGMQLLNPLTIEYIGLAARDILNVPRIDQLYFEASTIKQLEERYPVNPGRFHGHCGDATLLQPISQGMEVSSEGAKLTHRYFVTAFGYSDQMPLRTDVDAGGIDVDLSQILREILDIEFLRL